MAMFVTVYATVDDVPARVSRWRRPVCWLLGHAQPFSIGDPQWVQYIAQWCSRCGKRLERRYGR